METQTYLDKKNNRIFLEQIMRKERLENSKITGYKEGKWEREHQRGVYVTIFYQPK